MGNGDISMNVDIEFFSGEIDASTGETTSKLVHIATEVHQTDAWAQVVAVKSIVKDMKALQPLPEIKSYYAEYVWPDQGDGK